MDCVYARDDAKVNEISRGGGNGIRSGLKNR